MDYWIMNGRVEESLSQFIAAPTISKDAENHFYLETYITVEFLTQGREDYTPDILEKL